MESCLRIRWRRRWYTEFSSLAILAAILRFVSFTAPFLLQIAADTVAPLCITE